MHDWISKLDDFLKVSDRDVLTHAGRLSHDEAIQKAHAEYAIYREKLLTGEIRVKVNDNNGQAEDDS